MESLAWKSTISNMKNSLEGLKSRFDLAGKNGISKPENRFLAII
jgi:hypothetical protein